MARSLKKGPYVHHSLEKKVMKNIQENKKVSDQNMVTCLLDYSRFCRTDHWCAQR